jgi:hypothetical protein
VGKRLRLKGGSLYYAGSVTAEEAERAGRHLVERGYFEAGLTDVRLVREGTTYQLQLIGTAGPPDEEQNAACEVLAAVMSDKVLSGAAVEVHICDRILRPSAVIPHQGRFGRRIGMNAASLFYTGGVTEEDALRVATFLAAAGLFNESSKVAQLNRAGAGFEFRLAVEVNPLTTEMIEGQHQMASDLSHKVLGGQPVEVHYCHGLAATLRVDRTGPTEGNNPQAQPPRGRSYSTQVFSHLRETPNDNEPRPESE